VVNGNSAIDILVCEEHHQSVRVTCDGQNCVPIERDRPVRIRRAEKALRLIHPPGHDHFEIMRAKLGWGGHPSGKKR
jgi:NAD+ kinase